MDPNASVLNLIAGPTTGYDIYVQKLDQLALGIPSHQQALPIIIYPNPAGDLLNVSTAGATEIGVINIFGQELFRKKTEGISSIDVSFLSNGIYFVKDLQTGGTAKFVKQ